MRMTVTSNRLTIASTRTELEDKPEEARPPHTALGPVDAGAHRAEHRLDRVGGAQVYPVPGREVVKVNSTSGSLARHSIALAMNRSKAMSAAACVSAIPMPCSRAWALGQVPAVPVPLYKRGIVCAMVVDRYRGRRNGRSLQEQVSPAPRTALRHEGANTSSRESVSGAGSSVGARDRGG